jgi:hypothetical protein
MSRIRKAICERKRIIVAVLASVIVFVLANLVLAFLFGSQIRSSSPFAFGTNNRDTFMSLVFLEGGTIFGLGAFFASGISDIRTNSQANPRNAIRTEKTVSYVPEQGKKLMSTGTFLMLVGCQLLAISVLLVIVMG